MKPRIPILLVAAAAVVVLCSTAVLAQSNSTFTDRTVSNLTRGSTAGFHSAQRFQNQAFQRAAPRFLFSNVNRDLFSTRQVQKPFAGAQRSASVSPYLGLGGGRTSTVNNYYSLVRPQMQQQRQNERLRNAQVRQQQQLQAATARSPFSYGNRLEGAQDLMPTGHGASFLNFFGYYPQPRR